LWLAVVYSMHVHPSACSEGKTRNVMKHQKKKTNIAQHRMGHFVQKLVQSRTFCSAKPKCVA
jgi:hypothetical protein